VELSYKWNVLMENRQDLLVDCCVTLANGFGERDAAQEMAADCTGAYRKMIGDDKEYVNKGFFGEMRRLGVTPMWHRTRHAVGAQPLMDALHATRNMPRRSMSVVALKSSSLSSGLLEVTIAYRCKQIRSIAVELSSKSRKQWPQSARRPV
jgi:hypothetical protein